MLTGKTVVLTKKKKKKRKKKKKKPVSVTSSIANSTLIGLVINALKCTSFHYLSAW